MSFMSGGRVLDADRLEFVYFIAEGSFTLFLPPPATVQPRPSLLSRWNAGCIGWIDSR